MIDCRLGNIVLGECSLGQIVSPQAEARAASLDLEIGLDVLEYVLASLDLEFGLTVGILCPGASLDLALGLFASTAPSASLDLEIGLTVSLPNRGWNCIVSPVSLPPTPLPRRGCVTWGAS